MFREGKREGGETCRLLALTGTGLVGFATSKKIGNTPQRNRAKRRARACWRAYSTRRSNLDYIVLVTPQGAEAPFETLKNELGAHLDAMHRRWAAE